MIEKPIVYTTECPECCLDYQFDSPPGWGVLEIECGRCRTVFVEDEDDYAKNVEAQP